MISKIGLAVEGVETDLDTSVCCNPKYIKMA